MRGKGKLLGLFSVRTRITPAYAGKRRNMICRSRVTRDHPRLCGEKLQSCLRIGVKKGSPPPMRGKGSNGAGGVKMERITPAYAGKSFTTRYRACRREDHPRLCGEKVYNMKKVHRWTGSPPPMRGKVCLVHVYKCALRITPAYAGKRRIAWCRFHLLEDHPRLCGEKGRVAAGVVAVSGSPPPMRGKVPKSGGAMDGDRITPAYAGKSESRESAA